MLYDYIGGVVGQCMFDDSERVFCPNLVTVVVPAVGPSYNQCPVLPCRLRFRRESAHIHHKQGQAQHRY